MSIDLCVMFCGVNAHLFRSFVWTAEQVHINCALSSMHSLLVRVLDS